MKSLFAGVLVVTTLAAGCGGGGSTGGTGGAGGGGSGGSAGSGGAGSGGSAGSGGAAGSGGTSGSGGGAGGSGGGAAGSGGAPDGGGGSGGAPDGGSTDVAAEMPVAANPRLPAGNICVAGMNYGNPLPANTTPVMVRGGFGFLEGPVWVASQNALFFSDFINAGEGTPGRSHRYVPATGTFEVFLPMPATNGLAVDAEGMLVAASHQDRKLIRINPATKQITDVMGGAMFNGTPFNCLNDLVLRQDGNIYFSDPTYQRGNRPGQPVAGYYRMTPTGTVTRIGMGVQPNGMSLSPDGMYLYVASAEDNGGGIKRFPVNADGSLGAETNFFNAVSDGMAIDCAGNVYLNARNRVQVVSPAGQSLGMVTGFSAAGGNFVTNAAFGGPEGKTLYITTSNILYRLEMNIPGLPN